MEITAQLFKSEGLLWAASPDVPQGVLSFDVPNSPSKIFPISGGLCWYGANTGTAPLADINTLLEEGHLLSANISLTVEATTPGKKLLLQAASGVVDHGGRTDPGFDTQDAALIDLISERSTEIRALFDHSLSLGLACKLQDWQGANQVNKDASPVIDIRIQSLGDEIRISDMHAGRLFCLEMQNGEMRALVYEGPEGHKAPVVVSVPETGYLTIDNEDYMQEPMPEDEEALFM